MLVPLRVGEALKVETEAARDHSLQNTSFIHLSLLV